MTHVSVKKLWLVLVLVPISIYWLMHYKEIIDSLDSPTFPFPSVNVNVDVDVNVNVEHEDAEKEEEKIDLIRTKPTTRANSTNTNRHDPILPKPLTWCPEAEVPDTTVGSIALTQSYKEDGIIEWGNILSPYWAGRSMAELGGYEYHGHNNNFGQGTWMEFLPTFAPARLPRKNVFDKVCTKCDSYNYYHRLSCVDGWSHIAPRVMNETQDALIKHSNRVSKEEKDAIFNYFNPNDWLIYNRCCIFSHQSHAPGVLRTYDAIPTDGEFNVYIMMGRKEDRYNLCQELVSESIKYMKKRNPAITVTILKPSTYYVDFSRLVFAPNVLIAASGSSWALWSAQLANSNNVVSHLPSWEMSINDTLLLPTKSVRWLTDVPTMPNPKWSERTAEIFDSPFGRRFSNTPEAREKVLQYFRQA